MDLSKINASDRRETRRVEGKNDEQMEEKESRWTKQIEEMRNAKLRNDRISKGGREKGVKMGKWAREEMKGKNEEE